MLPLVAELNKDLDSSVLEARLTEMFSYSHYRCFGLFSDDELVAVTSGWLTTRLYSGRQLELDNVIVKAQWRNKGVGRVLNEHIEAWARENDCLSCELNSYVTNPDSHCFISMIADPIVIVGIKIKCAICAITLDNGVQGVGASQRRVKQSKASSTGPDLKTPGPTYISGSKSNMVFSQASQALS